MGWCRASNAWWNWAAQSSKRIPGLSGLGSPEITRTSLASAAPPPGALTFTAKRSPDRCEKRSIYPVIGNSACGIDPSP